MSSDFSGTEIPLIPGELYGMRSFKIRKDGTLAPLHRNAEYVFTSGPQEAICDVGGINWSITMGNGVIHTFTTEAGTWHDKEDAPRKDCTCGFYGYFDATEPGTFMADGILMRERVNGIVRATGKCVVGNLGFRAQKVEIVGIVAGEVPSTVGARTKELIRMLGHKATKFQMRYYWGLWIAQILSLFWHSYDEDNAFASQLYNVLTIAVWAMFAVLMVGVVCMVYLSRSSTMAKQNMPPPDMSRKIRAQYPDVEFFNSLDDARAKYPLTKASELPQ